MHTVTPILYNIRSTHNVGSIFRTAECAGISHLYLTGYTPTPVDRFGRERDDIAKVALGAEKLVSWEYVETIEELMVRLKSEGVSVVALEQHARAVDYSTYAPSADMALILGEEVEGIPDNILVQCDDILEIPMFGKKESLNVSVAAGITLFRLIEKRT